jgi:lipoate-protein ligase A
MPPENSWLLVESGRGNPAFNMALDEALLISMPELAQPVLRFYGWTQPAATFGYFQKYSEVSQLSLLRPLVRRTTGGGLVPHDADWTYSVAFPAGHPWHGLKACKSYHRMHDWLRMSFAKLGIETNLAPDRRLSGPGQCFEGYEQSDVLWHGIKVAGAAQRRTRQGLLIQGSVQPRFDPAANRAPLEEAVQEVGAKEFGIRWQHFEPPSWLVGTAEKLAREKYSTTAYNQRR